FRARMKKNWRSALPSSPKSSPFAVRLHILKAKVVIALRLEGSANKNNVVDLGAQHFPNVMHEEIHLPLFEVPLEHRDCAVLQFSRWEEQSILHFAPSPPGSRSGARAEPRDEYLGYRKTVSSELSDSSVRFMILEPMNRKCE